MARPEEDGVLYAVLPGYITSKNDGQKHYIGARQLIALYGVAHYQCAVIDERNTRRDYYNLIPLYPRYDGDYNVGRVIQDMSWS